MKRLSIFLNLVSKNLKENAPVGAISAASNGAFGVWTKDSYGDEKDSRIPTTIGIARRFLKRIRMQKKRKNKGIKHEREN